MPTAGAGAQTGTAPPDAAESAWLPASRKEEALWVLDSLVPSSAVNNLTTAIRADGPLDPGDLAASLAVLTDRHPALRTVFHVTATGLFKEVLTAGGFSVEVPTARCVPDRLDAELQRLVSQPFSVDGTPLLRAAHLSDGAADVFLLVTHHLISDALSTQVLARELAAVYAARRHGMPPPEHLARDVPALVEGPPRPESIDYWHQQLQGFDPATLDLWCGSTVPDDPSLTGDYLTQGLSPHTREAIRAIQRLARAPEAAVLLAAYALLLVRHGAGPDIVVGTPASVRPLDAVDAVGYHINTLPLRVQVDLGAPLRDLVRQVRDVFFAALSHADVPVDMVLGDVRATSTGPWRNPVFRHLFNFVPDSASASSTDLGMGDVTGRRFLVENGFSKFDLEFFFVASPKEIQLRAAYDTDAFTATEVTHLVQRFQALLVELAGSPELPVGEAGLFGADDRQVIDAANRTWRPAGAESVLHRVAAQVRTDPGAVAVVDGDRLTTYAQVWHRAVELQGRLKEAGVGPGSIVALLMPRGVELAVAVLGVWLAGAAYLPLDPEHPVERLDFQLADSGARVVIAGPDAAVPPQNQIPVLGVDDGARPPVAASPDPASPDPGDLPAGEAPAYLIYTSGSTGQPKGTTVTHRSLINLVEHFEDELDAQPTDTTLWMTTFSFDVSALELFLPLATAGRACVCPDRARTDGRLLAELLDRYRIGIVQATPTTWRVLLDGVAPALTGRRVLCGGEPLPAALARRLVATGCVLRNVYGPTETTIWSTAGRVDPGGGQGDVGRPVDVGRPIANTHLLVVDPGGRELPVGVAGELWIAGDGVAVGYHRRPELTVERFVHHPRHGRAYRSGDLARWTAEGTVEILGRLDRQVKIRGVRVELAEVENALETHPGIQAAAAVLVRRGDGEPVLVAFLVPAGATPPSTEEVWRHAGLVLPRAAVPQEWRFVPTFPRTGNDKVDYRELITQAGDPAGGSVGGRDGSDDGRDTRSGQATDPLVGELVDLWRQFLGRDDVTEHSNFFAMGGHSLLAAQLLQRIEDGLQVRVKLADMFAQPTPVGVARCLRRADGIAHEKPDTPESGAL